MHFQRPDFAIFLNDNFKLQNSALLRICKIIIAEKCSGNISGSIRNPF